MCRSLFPSPFLTEAKWLNRAWFLTITSRDDGTKYSDFVKLQADKVLVNAAKPDEEGVYSNLWYAKDGGAAAFTAPAQGAALGALVAAGSLNC